MLIKNKKASYEKKSAEFIEKENKHLNLWIS